MLCLLKVFAEQKQDTRHLSLSQSPLVIVVVMVEQGKWIKKADEEKEKDDNNAAENQDDGIIPKCVILMPAMCIPVNLLGFVLQQQQKWLKGDFMLFLHVSPFKSMHTFSSACTTTNETGKEQRYLTFSLSVCQALETGKWKEQRAYYYYIWNTHYIHCLSLCRVYVLLLFSWINT